jgi:hypothetical protein
MLSEARSRESEVCRGGRRIERVNVRRKSEARWRKYKSVLNEQARHVSEREGTAGDASGFPRWGESWRTL